MTIYFDMDGTLADLYNVPGWLEKLRAGDTSPYREAASIHSVIQFTEQVTRLQRLGIKIGIISWCSKSGSKGYDREVRKTKKEWLNQKFPCISFDEIHIVKYGTSKAKVANDTGILFDDEKKNREEWEKENGFAFGADNIVETLSNLFNVIKTNGGV